MIDALEYKKILNNPTLDQKAMSKLCKQWRPKYLYRYRSLNSEHWRDELEKGEIYLSPCDKFNDPFEGLVYIDPFKLSKESVGLQSAASYYNISIDEIDEILKDDERRENIIKGFQKGVLCACFSESYDNILMWSHYADKGNGICIRYNFGMISKSVQKRILPVLYDEKRPDITEQMNDAPKNAIFPLLLTKAKEWEYEDEWRILVTRDAEDGEYGHGKKINEFEAIDGVIIGFNCSDDNRKEIINWANKNKREVFQIKIDNKAMKLVSHKAKV